MSSLAAGAAAPPGLTNSSVPRRSFTVPARLARKPEPRPSSSGSNDGIETLFTCTSTKIVSFTAGRPDSEGIIPCKSATERTLAVGVLRIYRVTSSNVSFLNSGNLLHTIFPKSQCWCVDGESKFALRIRQDSYYRIELPYESDEDKQKVEDFKSVLGQVLQYEKTRCPFTRGFEVELPERPKTPPRRKPSIAPGKAKKWLFDKTWVPEDGPRPATPVEGSDSGTISSYEEDDRSSIITDANETGPESPPFRIPPKAAVLPSVVDRAAKFQGLRSVTAPQRQLTTPSAPPQQPASRISDLPASTGDIQLEKKSEAKDGVETMSMISSADSFKTATQRSSSPETPQFLDAESELINPWENELGLQKEQDEQRGRARHRRQISDITVRPHSESAPHTPTFPTISATININIHPSSAPSTPPLVSDSEDGSLELELSLDAPTPPDTIRMRRLTGASQRRAYSPMPQEINLFRPPVRSTASPLTTALVRKTCELILGPPAHLVSLMLNIAARISKGAFGFDTYRIRGRGERIPCSWESSEDEWDEDEDDFGIPLGNLDGPTLRKRTPSGEQVD